MRIDRWKIFLDLEGGGAWPFLVGGVICLVNSVNERDLVAMVCGPYIRICIWLSPIRHSVGSRGKIEAITGLWCPSMFWAARALHCFVHRACPWVSARAIGKTKRAGDWRLIFFFMNEEFLVHTSQQRLDYRPCPLYTPPVATTDGMD